MKKFLLLVVLCLLAAAYLMNPSKEEAVAEVKKAMIEQSQDEGIISNLLKPTVIINLVTVDVNNYYLFSTYEAYVDVTYDRTDMAHGMIIFGKVFLNKD